MQQAIQVFFTGNVQGVGFRNQVMLLAKAEGIQGWVRNLPDGRVEMHAQVNLENLGKVLDKLSKTFRITRCETLQSAWDDSVKDFRIVR